MGFKTAVIAIKAASVGTGIKAMLRKQKADAKLTISLSERIGNELDWRDGDKLEVLIGDAEHHGLLRLRKNNSVGIAAVSHRKTTRGGWLAIPLGHQSVFVNRAEGGALVSVGEGRGRLDRGRSARLGRRDAHATVSPLRSFIVSAFVASPARRQRDRRLDGRPGAGSPRSRRKDQVRR